jgi:hypothetical protein
MYLPPRRLSRGNPPRRISRDPLPHWTSNDRLQPRLYSGHPPRRTSNGHPLRRAGRGYRQTPATPGLSDGVANATGFGLPSEAYNGSNRPKSSNVSRIDGHRVGLPRRSCDAPFERNSILKSFCARPPIFSSGLRAVIFLRSPVDGIQRGVTRCIRSPVVVATGPPILNTKRR